MALQPSNLWYDIKEVISYNCLFNFIIGMRGGGKSFSFKEYAISDFLKTGKQFIYLRRYKTDLKKVSNFFDDIVKENKFPLEKFAVKGNVFYINNKIAGWAVPLTTALTEKSNSYPNVNKIGFDEFIIENSSYHYLKDEVTQFLSFYETVARNRNDVRVFFIANAVTVVNPYFIFFGIIVDKTRRFQRIKEDIIVDYYKNDTFTKMKRETRFGKIVAGTEYSDYAIDNEFVYDNHNFIEKKSGKLEYGFSIHYKKQTFGFWYNYDEGKIYASYDIDPYSTINYSLTSSDMKPNMLLITSSDRDYYLKALKKAYKYGYLYYESLKVKKYVFEILKLLGL